MGSFLSRTTQSLPNLSRPTRSHQLCSKIRITQAQVDQVWSIKLLPALTGSTSLNLFSPPSLLHLVALSNSLISSRHFLSMKVSCLPLVFGALLLACRSLWTTQGKLLRRNHDLESSTFICLIKPTLTGSSTLLGSIQKSKVSKLLVMQAKIQ